MEQLPGSDAIFLAMETETVYAHVGGLVVLDPSGAPGFGFERVKRVTGERIRQVPRFTKRLRCAPFDLDRPYLVDDPHFDVANHIHRIAVPSPGVSRATASSSGASSARCFPTCASPRSLPSWACPR